MNWWLGAAIGAAVVGAIAVVTARRRYLVVSVRGPSMRPTLEHGDRILVRRSGRRPPGRGDVVVLHSPINLNLNPNPGSGSASALLRLPPVGEGVWIVKRVVAAPGDPIPEAAATACGRAAGTPVPAGLVVVFGDGPASQDSRIWGFLPLDLLLGVVLRRISSAPRRRGSEPVEIR